MNHEEEIRKLEESREDIIGFTTELDKKLLKEEIDGIEYHILLNERLDGRDKHDILAYLESKISHHKKESEHKWHKSRTSVIFGAVVIVIMIVAMLSVGNIDLGSPTGLVIGPSEVTEAIVYDRVYEAYTETGLELNDLTSLRISGVLEGTRAVVKLRLEDGTEYIIADIQKPEADNLITGMAVAEEPVEEEPIDITENISSEYSLTTDKVEYELGETVYVILKPDTENKSLYIEFGEEIHKIEGDTYVTENLGEHNAIALVVLPDDILRLENGFTVIEAVEEIVIESVNETNTTEPEVNETINESEPEINETVNETDNNTANASDEIGYAFENLCLETCTLSGISNPVLIVELEEGAKLTITDLIITQTAENKAPEQAKAIPNIAVAPGEVISINLNEYFVEPDEDEVFYDINEITEINAVIEGNVLTISSDNFGAYTAFIYATDGDKLTTSNTFTISVDEVGGGVITPSNETIETPEVIPTTLIDPCSHPNPNMRPIECMEGLEEEYFKDQSLYLRNLDRVKIARITAFGNLVIKGVLVENAIGSPGPRDFRISYALADGETEVTTAWIDSETGDLHLKGNLFEEQFTLLPGNQDTFMIQNRKGTNLGYFERKTGNLYLRGNLLQGRE